jgi:hypothetical protein
LKCLFSRWDTTQNQLHASEFRILTITQMETRFGLERNACFDEFIQAEFLLRYEHSSVERKIDLLNDLKFADGLDERLQLMIAQDSSPLVRLWAAKNLDIRRTKVDVQTPESFRSKIFSLLFNDTEAVVSSALFENPGLLGSRAEDVSRELFKIGNHQQRLALMRNPELSVEFAIKIFDPTDTSLEINEDKRLQYIRALFSNIKFLIRPRLRDEAFIGGAEAVYNIRKDYEALLRVAMKWPANHYVRTRAAAYIFGNTQDKLRIYQESTKAYAQLDIIQSCTRREMEILKLASENEDPDCRKAARKRLAALENPLDVWDPEDIDGWVEYGIERNKWALHPHVAILNNFSFTQRVEYIHAILFFFAQTLYTLRLRARTLRTSFWKAVRTLVIWAIIVAVIKYFSSSS